MKANRSMRTPAPRAAVTGVVAALLLAACSSLLDVNDPDVINPPDVQNADGAVGAYNGGLGDFAFANDGDNGGTEGQILVSGVMSDEYTDVETFPTRIEYDSRAIDERNTTLRDVYFNLHKARVALEGAVGALQQYAPTPNSRIGEMLALSGFTYVYFAENYCSAVPFSQRLPDGSIQNGTPMSTKAILARALSRFDSALVVTATLSAASDSAARRIVRTLAAVGRGRALLDSGRPDQLRLHHLPLDGDRPPEERRVRVQQSGAAGHGAVLRGGCRGDERPQFPFRRRSARPGHARG